MSDYIIRGMAADKQVRFFAANTKDLVEKARRIHNTSPIATAALGRLMTGTAMMEVCVRMTVILLPYRLKETVLWEDLL